jgi:hypothetical protein
MLSASRLPAEESLARIVPADAGLCLEVDGLAEQLEAIAAGTMLERWRAFPPLAAWQEKNVPALKLIAGQISQQLGVSVLDVWRQGLGRRSLLAVWPPDPEHPDITRGLLLVEALDEQLLPRLLQGLRQAQERSGELIEYREATHAGITYRVHGMKRGGERSTVYLAATGRLGVLATHEDLLHRALELRAAAEKVAGLANEPAYQAARQRVEPGAAVRLVVNPRAWDAALRAMPRAANPNEARSQELVQSGWEGIRWGAASLRLAPHPTLEIHVEFEPFPDSSPLVQMLESFAGEAALVQQTPAEALLAIVGRIDLGRLIRLAATVESAAKAETAPKQPNPALAIWNLLDQLLAGVGPEWSAVVVPAEGGTQRLPFDLVVSLETRSQTAAAGTMSDADLQSTLRTLLLMLATANNLQPDAAVAEVTSTEVGGRRFQQVVNLESLPQGMTATFATLRRCVVAGTSLEAVGKIFDVESSASLAASPSIKRVVERLGVPGHLFYINLARTRESIARNAAPLAAHLAQEKGVSVEEARKGLAQVESVLALADVALVAIRVERESIALRAELIVEQH